jgi:16S rRNA (cytosine967-C5)-methyltransferase
MNAPRRDGPRRDGPRRGRRDHGAHSAPPRGRVGPGRPPELDPARQAALELLTAVRTRDAYANLALPAILRRHRLRDRDAGLATELGYGTLRARGLLDAIIEACTDRPLNRVEPPLLDALRLGAYQLLRTRVPAHAAVDTTVELVRAEAGSRSAGFVNAILRKVGELDEPAWVQRLAPPAAEDPVGYAAFAHAHPRWIAQAFADALGPGALAPVASARAPGAAAPGAAASGAAAPGAAAPDAAPGAGAPGAGAPDGPAPTGADPGPTELAAALAADDARPAVHLLGRPGEITAAELALVTGGTEAPYSPYGVQLEPGSGDVGELEVVREGLAIVQDEGSQLVALAAVRAPTAAAGSTCAPGRGASRCCSGRWPRWTGRPWTRWRSASTGRTWCAGPSTACRSPCTWPTGGTPRSRPAGTTGCWSTPRAPGSVRSGVDPRPAGGAARTTCPA